MAVSSVGIQHRGRGGSKGMDGRKSYTIAYVVRTDNAYDDAGVVMAACPSRIGDTYRNGIGYTDAKSYCQEIRPEQDEEDRHTWRVYAEFRPQDKQRTVISVRYEKKKVALTGVRKSGEVVSQSEPTMDANGHSVRSVRTVTNLYEALVANSFGDPFDPAPEYEVSYPVITFKRREERSNFPLWAHFKDAVNNAPWNGFKPGTAKIMSITAEHEYIFEPAGTEKKIWWVTYQIGIDEDTWAVKKLDAGYHYYTHTAHAEGPGKIKPFLDTDNNPRIGLLDNESRLGTGTQVGIALVDLTTPQFRSFDVYPDRSFALLALPVDPDIIEPL